MRGIGIMSERDEKGNGGKDEQSRYSGDVVETGEGGSTY